VRAAEKRSCDLSDFTLDELRAAMAEVKGAAEKLDADVAAAPTVEGSLAARNHIGGTAPEQVRAAIGRARGRLG